MLRTQSAKKWMADDIARDLLLKPMQAEMKTEQYVVECDEPTESVSLPPQAVKAIEKILDGIHEFVQCISVDFGNFIARAILGMRCHSKTILICS